MNRSIVPVALLAALTLSACQGGASAPNQNGPQNAAPAAQLSATKQIPVGKTPHGMWAALGFVYNSNVGEGTLSVIDAATDAVLKNIPFTDGTPGYIKAFHDGKNILITDTKLGNLLVIDPAQDHKILQTIPVGQSPDKIRISEDDTQVLVSLVGEPKAVLLTFGADRTQAPTRKDFAIGPAIGEHRDAQLVEGWAVLPNNGDNTVSLINLASGNVQTVTGGNNPGPVAIGTSGETAVVAIAGNAASNTLSFFDLPGGKVTNLDGVGLSPTDIVVDPQLHRAFVTMAGSNEVAVVDYTTKTLVGKVPTGNRPVHIYMAPVMPEAGQEAVIAATSEALSHELWVGNDAGDSVTIFDGESLRVKATVATDKGHHKMAFWGTKGYVSNITTNDVSVIDRTQIK